jgi:hypothetical protein
MAALDASAIARLLREFGQRTALRGGNPFSAKAYARAADGSAARNAAQRKVGVIPRTTLAAWTRCRWHYLDSALMYVSLRP